jgi:hypothetical protein
MKIEMNREKECKKRIESQLVKRKTVACCHSPRTVLFLSHGLTVSVSREVAVVAALMQ